jgi:DNA mismatch repair protein MutL
VTAEASSEGMPLRAEAIMGRIHRLSQSVVNRIAAGEVVERPASVLRELLDNALDSGANRIDVTLEKGGVELVRVVDNGGGIAADELPLAVAAHATSKLSSADDLERINTFGFRGEALASIAEVSRLVIRSRPPGDAAGSVLEVDAGQVGDVLPEGCAVGTTVEVHQLFAKVPARRSFLRSGSTEWSHASDVFTRAALAHPQVAFSLVHGNRRAFDLPAVENWVDRIEGLFGRAVGQRLIRVEAEDGDVQITGYIGRPEADMASARLQHMLVRGRPIRDRSLGHAIQEAYRGTMLTGRHPMVFLRIELPAEQVDVNVHPAKSEVRFREPSRLYRLLLSAVRTALLESDLSTALKPPVWTESSAAVPAFRPFESGPPRPSASGPAYGQQFFSPPPAAASMPSAAVTAGDAVAPPAHFQAERPMPPTVPREFAVQMHDRYLVVQTSDGIEVVDQHALHERLLFERLRKEVAGEGLEIQKLLVPEPVELAAAEAALLLEHAEALATAGVTVTSFSGSTVLVSSKPALAADTPAVSIVQEILTRLEAAASPSTETIVEEVLHSLACRAAIKAGDRLSQSEVDTLVRDRHLAASSHCPHGRPTTLTLTNRELDRQFRRT